MLLIWGERDNLNPVASVAKKARLAAGCHISCSLNFWCPEVAGYFTHGKLLVIPRAGHIALCDKPAEARK